MKYLQEEQYYIDLYDLHTIEQCLNLYNGLKEGMEKRRNEIKDMKPEEFGIEVHKCVSYTVNILKTNRYRDKEKTINEWIEKYSMIQEKYDNAIPPHGIYCKECGSAAKVTSKDLLGVSDDDSQVLFMFECINCKKKQAFYEDGTEWHHEDPKCPECQCELLDRSKYNKTKDVLTTIESCSKCSYTKKDIHDFKKSRGEREAKEAKDKKLLATYREMFCYNDEVGPKAVMSLDGLMRFADEMKEKEKKEKDPVFQKAKQLKQVKIVQLKELLEKAITKEGYKDLQFGKPEMGQFVIIDFTINDSSDDRQKRESENTLKKLIKEVLEDTNWRLMTDGIHYRLGILTGRLKAYERQEDLMGLVK